MDSRGHLRTPIILWVVFTIILEAIYLIIAPILAQAGAIPPLASDVADNAWAIMKIFTILSIPVFVGVVTFAAYSLFTFRTHGRPTQNGPAIQGNARLLFWWLAVSFALCTVLYVIGFNGLAQLEAAAPASALHVRVTAQQWIFNYTYTDYSLQSSTLYLPEGQPVEFTVTSLDVHHSFWIPEMGVKADAIPGELQHLHGDTEQARRLHGALHGAVRRAALRHEYERRRRNAESVWRLGLAADGPAAFGSIRSNAAA